MKRTQFKLITLFLIIITFSASYKVEAAPELFVGFILNHEYYGNDGWIENEIIFDNDTFWTVDHGIYDGEGSLIFDSFITVNKTANHNTYNFTEFEKATGDVLYAAQSYGAWIDTDGLAIGQNITIGAANATVTGIVDRTTPLGIFSCYNITIDYIIMFIYQYYNINNGILIEFYLPDEYYGAIISETNYIAEFPNFLILPITFIILLTIIKINKKKFNI